MKKAKPKKRIIKRAKKKMVKKTLKRRPKKSFKKKRPLKKARKKKMVRKKPAKKKIVKKRARKRPVKKRVIRKKPIRKKKVKKPAKRIGGGSLEQLFESPAKVQTMKLFFRNPEVNFLSKEAAKIMKMNLDLAKKQIKRLEKIGLLKTRQVSPRKQLFSINPNFDFFNELRELILKSSPVSKDKMLKAVRGLGKMKLVLLSGLFTGNDMARADLLIVGDSINQRKLTGFIKNLEAEAGTDINCVVMTTEEFKYRYNMYDRFVRDLLSEKSELLINRLGM